jgi:peptide/nickel transport system substrate-binding protein
MKKRNRAITLALVATITFTMFSALLTVSTQAQGSVKGPPLDVIYLDVRTSQDVGVGDTAAGRTDVFLWSASEAVWKRMPLSMIANLKLIRTASGYWSLVFNPVEDDPAVPGVVNTTSGEVHFNPFALKDVRYAMNWLIDRSYIITETVAGGGAPMYSPVQPSEPAIEQVEHVYTELGLTGEGDFTSANDTINDALNEAATTLATYGYTLYQKPDPNAPAGFWWTFKGNWTGATEEPVTLNFLIRIEDERHEEGLHIADLIEKTGINVEPRERDRYTCILKCYYTDPKDDSTYEAGLWHIYTEGWVAMAEWLYPEVSIAQMYAPWYTYMPGWQEEGWWWYTNDTLEETTQKLVTGPIADATEYWNLTAYSVKMGIQESVRIFVAETWEYFAVNPRVTNIAYGAVSGLWPMWPFRTATTPDGILKATQFSAAGALFMSAWNTIGGFTDVYSELIWRYIRDYADYPHPMEAEPIPVRTDFTVEKDDIDVPTTAVFYNAAEDAWVEVGADKKVAAKVTFNYKLSNWHHGEPMTMADILNTFGFQWEWSTEDYPGDPYYNSRYAGSVAPVLAEIAGIQIINSTAIVVYGNYTHPISDAVTADYYATWPTLPWEVLTGMEDVVVNGGAVSGDNYNWYQTEGVEWIDMLVPDHVADIKAAMTTLKGAGYISNYTKVTGYTPTADEATSRYQSSTDWAEEHTNVAISNGPYYLESYDPAAMVAELRAFRDETYPFTPYYWQSELFLTKMEIRKIDSPTEVAIGDDVPVDVYPLLKTEFPVPKEELATIGHIEVSLKDPGGTEVYSGVADYKVPGLFSLTIPGNTTAEAAGGVYTLDVSAAVEKGLFPARTSVPLKVSIPKFALTIGVSPLGEGDTSPGIGTLTYEKGTDVTVTVTPAEGYEFESWELDGVPISNETTVTVSMDQIHHLVARLKETPPPSPVISLEILSAISLILAIVAIAVAVILPYKMK